MKFLLLMLLAWGTVCAQTRQADLILSGRLKGSDHQTYVQVPLDVPASTQRITVEFEYTGKQDRSVIDLGLLGPDGRVLGWSGGNKSHFTVSALDATPSYSPTPIREGRWHLLLGVPNMRQLATADYEAHVYFSKTLSAIDEPELLAKPLNAQAGWYRGDLHAHTAHSDGSCATFNGKDNVPCPVFVTAMSAAQRGLDFMAITDHNTLSHANSIRELQPYFNPMLLLVGREVTTFFGHANVFGTLSDLNFQIDKDEKNWNRILQTVQTQKGLVSINHPVRPSGELCMGCGWDTPSDMRQVQAIEVVNGADADTLFSGMPFWHSQLNLGHRITAISGSDNHRPDQKEMTYTGSVGRPSTVVYAKSLSQIDVLEAIRQGHVFIDNTGSKDKLLEMHAHTDKGPVVMMGDSLKAGAGAEIQFKTRVRHAQGAHLEWWLDGQPLEMGSHDNLKSDQVVESRWKTDGKAHWIRVDVREAGGKLVLLGNPIYISP